MEKAAAASQQATMALNTISSASRALGNIATGP